MSEPFNDGILVRGAREHNLKNLDVFIPRNKITVITGLSGSGKSSLAFDTIYAEGQRRYVESLSAYARNFLEQLKKPEVDSIFGLSPAISIEQKTTSSNPRSTVGTVTELYDFLRLLYARAGIPHCPTHGEPVSSQTPSQIIDNLMTLPAETKINILAPVARAKKGEFFSDFQKWLKRGFVRARIDGAMVDLDSAKRLEKNKVHNIELVIDRLIIKPGVKPRLSEAVNLALKMADGFLIAENLSEKTELTFALKAVCPKCLFSFPEIEPRLFSFNNPRGSCPQCDGLGYIGSPDAEDGTDEESEDSLDQEPFVSKPCELCLGYRLRTETLHILLNGKHIGEVSRLSLEDLSQFLSSMVWPPRTQIIVSKVLAETQKRLNYILDLGLGYLSLDRPMRTLSGGEAQRIRLATQLGSSLVGVLYVLDEPSIGLHARDHARLLAALARLRDLGNTIVLVEHDEDTIRFADHVIDLGPGAGFFGGEILAIGSPKDIMESPKSVTGKFLSGRVRVFEPRPPRAPSQGTLSIYGATGNNLKKLDLHVRLGSLTCVTGVSGSGKSTLVIDTLYRHLAQHFHGSTGGAAPFERIDGVDRIDGIVNIDQRPIGRTPRSNPATYVGLFSQIRDLFSFLPDSKLRGFKPGRFSFNVKGGRCEACEGAGAKRIEMHFMADVFVPCDVCQGSRYNRETLSVKYREKTIADVLAMPVREAHKFFENHKIIHRKLDALMKVGLDYISLGQASTTLSGGEAQRIKLSRELSKKGSGKTLYILDEPTTGLHFEDIKKLIELLHVLVDSGNTVVVIEHNLDVIRAADFLIDLGPEGGGRGGRIIATGTPQEVSRVSISYTGQFLEKYFKQSPDRH